MKVLIPKRDLLGIIERVRGVVETRTTIPILTNVKLVAADGKLTIITSDLQIQASASVDASIQEEGALCVEAKQLHGFVSKARANSPIQIDGGTFTSGKTEARFETLPPDDYPAMTQEGGEPFTLTPDQVRHLLVEPSFAASDESTRYYLCGVYFRIADGEAEHAPKRLHGVATDGHVLVQHEGELPEDAPEALGVIIPSKTIAVLTKCLGDDPVAITASNSHIHFHTGKAEILSRLVDGAYPDYQRVIPKERDRRATVDREEMLATLDRVATFAKDDTRGVKLVPIAEALVLRTAQANDEVEAEIEGKFPSIAFNQKKVASVLSVLKCKRVEIYANDAGAPAVIIDPAMPNDIHVVMPLRMN